MIELLNSKVSSYNLLWLFPLKEKKKTVSQNNENWKLKCSVTTGFNLVLTKRLVMIV